MNTILATVFLLLLLVSIVVLGWILYDAGYDQGWTNRDNGKP